MNIAHLNHMLNAHNRHIHKASWSDQTPQQSQTLHKLSENYQRVLTIIYKLIHSHLAPISNAKLSEPLHISKTYVSLIITRLDHWGYLKKTGLTTQRRIQLTKLGLSIVKKRQPEWFTKASSSTNSTSDSSLASRASQQNSSSALASKSEQSFAKQSSKQPITVKPTQPKLRFNQLTTIQKRVFQALLTPFSRDSDININITQLSQKHQIDLDNVREALQLFKRRSVLKPSKYPNQFCLGRNGLDWYQHFQARFLDQQRQLAKQSGLPLAQYMVFKAILGDLKVDHQNNRYETNVLNKTLKRSCPAVANVNAVIQGLLSRGLITIQPQHNQSPRILVLTEKGRQLSNRSHLRSQLMTLTKPQLVTPKPSPQALKSYQPLNIKQLDYPFALVFKNVYPVKDGLLLGTEDQIILQGNAFHRYLASVNAVRFYQSRNVSSCLAVSGAKKAPSQHLANQTKIITRGHELVIWSCPLVKKLSAYHHQTGYQYLQAPGQLKEGLIIFDLNRIEPSADPYK